MEEFWDGMRNLTIAGALLDQRVEEFMVMQQSLIYKRPQCKVRDGWEWIGAQFSIKGHTRGSVRGNTKRANRSSKHVGLYRDCYEYMYQSAKLMVQRYM